MKILYVSLQNSKYGMGGAEQTLLDLALSMRNHHGAQVKIAVSEGDLYDKLQKEGFDTTALYFSKWRSLETFCNLKRAISRLKPDIIHSHHRFTTFLAATFFKHQAKIIHSEHVLRRDKKLLFRSGDFIIAGHETVRQNMMQHFGVADAKIGTIPYAVTPPEVCQDEVSRIRAKYNPKGSRTLILSVGRLVEQKGHAYLIDAVSKLSKSQRLKCRFLLAGDGPLEHQLKKKVRHEQLDDAFVFLGYTRPIEDYIAACDLMILPSLWEGMPLVVLKAFCLGKTVLASDIPGIREEILHEKTGYLVPPRSAKAIAQGLSFLLENPQKLQAIGTAAKTEASKKNSFSTMIEHHRKLYEKILAWGHS